MASFTQLRPRARSGLGYFYVREALGDLISLEGTAIMDLGALGQSMKNEVLDALQRGWIYQYDNPKWLVYHHICQHFQIHCHGVSIGQWAGLQLGTDRNRLLDLSEKLQALWGMVDREAQRKSLEKCGYMNRSNHAALWIPSTSRMDSNIIDCIRPVGMKKETLVRFIEDIIPKRDPIPVQMAIEAVAKGQKIAQSFTHIHVEQPEKKSKRKVDPTATKEIALNTIDGDLSDDE